MKKQAKKATKPTKPLQAWAYVDNDGNIVMSATVADLEGGYRLQPSVYCEHHARCLDYAPFDLRVVYVEIREVAKAKR